MKYHERLPPEHPVAIPGVAADMWKEPRVCDEGDAFAKDFSAFINMDMLDEHTEQDCAGLPSSIIIDHGRHTILNINTDHALSGLSTTKPKPPFIETFLDAQSEAFSSQQSTPQISNPIPPAVSDSSQGGIASSVKAATKKRKIPERGDVLPGQFCFYVNSEKPSFQRTARYSDDRLQELKKLKTNGGACLRCREIKKQVALFSLPALFSLRSDFDSVLEEVHAEIVSPPGTLRELLSP